MTEIKPISGFDFQYYVDRNGNIYRQLTPNKTHEGYMRLGLRNKGVRKWFFVHRVVAKTFIPNPQNKKYVNHIDGDKTNNKVENLEWCSQSENMVHAYNTGLKSPSHPKAVHMLDKEGDFILATFPSREEAARHVGTSGSNIAKAIRTNGICAGHRWEEVVNV